MSETSEQRQQRFRELRESVATTLLQQYPDVTFDRHQYGIDVIHYVVHFSGGRIQVGKRKRGINNSVFSLDSYYLTEQAAKQAIGEHIPAATAKFEQCLTALNQLKQSMDFDVSYSVEGDTHGIQDYPYISFKMGGFDFTFEIDQ